MFIFFSKIYWVLRFYLIILLNWNEFIFLFKGSRYIKFENSYYNFGLSMAETVLLELKIIYATLIYKEIKKKNDMSHYNMKVV